MSRVLSSRCLSADENFVVQPNDIVSSRTSRYQVLDFVGKGAFGKVAKTVNLTTAKDVALKFVTHEDKRASERELKMLQIIRVLDPVKTRVVHFFEMFDHKGLTCLSFEMLDRSLFQFLEDRQLEPLSLNEIRPIALQLLTALDALKELGVIHADLKADNIMLVNHQDQPFSVKLIDFGLSLQTHEVRVGLTVQPVGCRAPEVHLGLPFTEAIDMWGLGCILTLLSVSGHLFTLISEYQNMKDIVDVLGQPADHLLDAGIFTHKYFKLNRHFHTPKWWLKTPLEYERDSGLQPKKSERVLNNLDDLVTLYPYMGENIEVEDRRAFLSLLKSLLQTDPEKRISPGDALKHPFITMAHLEEEADTSMYVDEANDNMIHGQFDDSNVELLFSSETEEEQRAGETPACFPEHPVPSVSPGSSTTAQGATDASAEESAAFNCTAGDCEEEEEETRPIADVSTVIEEPGRKRGKLRRIRKFFSRVFKTVFRRS